MVGAAVAAVIDNFAESGRCASYIATSHFAVDAAAFPRLSTVSNANEVTVRDRLGGRWVSVGVAVTFLRFRSSPWRSPLHGGSAERRAASERVAIGRPLVDDVRSSEAVGRRRHPSGSWSHTGRFPPRDLAPRFSSAWSCLR